MWSRAHWLRNSIPFSINWHVTKPQTNQTALSAFAKASTVALQRHALQYIFSAFITLRQKSSTQATVRVFISTGIPILKTVNWPRNAARSLSKSGSQWIWKCLALLSVQFICPVIAHCKTVFLGFLLSPVANVTIWPSQRSEQEVMRDVRGQEL